jgi:hypothetical protein
MFWTIVAPFFTTCALAVVAVVAATTLAPRWRARRERACLATTALAIVLFVPSCLAIELGMNTLRFGVFRYESGRDIGDWRVERYMPGAAREITLMKYPAGFDAEFHIARADLEGWLDEQWALHRASADANFHGAAPPIRGEPRPIEPDMIDLHLPGRPDGGLVLSEEWPRVTDAIEFEGPRKPNGAGVTFLYSPSRELCFARAGYW